MVNATTAPNRQLYLLEVEVFEVEMYFDDAGGLDARSQYVLLGRHVVLGAKPIQVVKKTGTRVIYRSLFTNTTW